MNVAEGRNNLVYRRDVEDAVVADVRARDPENLLSARAFADIVGCITQRVCSHMVHVDHVSLDDEDRNFIRRASTRMMRACLQPPGGHRFGLNDRVVCYLARRRAWAAGTIVKIDEDDSEDPTDQTVVPYLVKIDPPNSRIICVPVDDNETVRAEVCFGQYANAVMFSLFCKPQKEKTTRRRFAAGDRVACVVEDPARNAGTWAAGTVLEVNYDAAHEGVFAEHRQAGDQGVLAELNYGRSRWDWPSANSVIPYRVLLDSGVGVLAHRDEHWLVRDLRLQSIGPCQSVGCARRLTRFTRRQPDDKRLWTPQQTHLFPREFRARALATLCAAHRLRTHPPLGIAASLGDLPSELLLGIIALSAGREFIDHMTRQIRVQSPFDSDDDE